MKITRAWAMPNKYTFEIRPIEALIQKYVKDRLLWADPFSGKSRVAYYRNDLNIDMGAAVTNLKACVFLETLQGGYLKGVLFDPPYSPRQISECYKGIGLEVTQKDTQNQWVEEKNEIARILRPGGICISFGWNSNGMGKKRGFSIKEVLLVAHGAAHNDTICTVEVKI